MGHYYNRFPFEELLQVVHNHTFIVGVERVGGLIEEKVFGILVHGTCNEDTLALTLADTLALGANLRIVAQGQFGNHLLDVGNMGGMEQPGVVYMVDTHCDIAGNGVGKDKTVLHHRAALVAPEMMVDVVQQKIAHPDLSSRRSIESQQQLHQGRLAAATHPHNGGHFPLRDGKIDLLEHCIGERVIVERKPLYPEAPVLWEDAGPAGCLLFLVLAIMDFAETFQADFGILGRLHEGNHLIDGQVELTYDVLDSRHHTQRHVSADDRCRRDKGDDDILGFVDEESAALLVLAQGQTLDADAGQGQRFGLGRTLLAKYPTLR